MLNFGSIIVSILAAGLCANAAAQRWDAKADWRGSGEQPENGWYFFEYDEGAGEYTPLEWNAAESCWQGSQRYAQIGAESHCPDRVDVVRAWKAPGDGKVHITSAENVRKAINPDNNGGDGAVVRVYRNRYRCGEAGLAYDDDTGFPLDVTLRVNEGDWLYFHVNPKWHSGWDSVILAPVIEFTAGEGYDPTVRTVTLKDLFKQGNSREWVAPAAGTLHIDTLAPMVLDGGRTMTVEKEGALLWASDALPDRPADQDFSVRTGVNEGDVLEFALAGAQGEAVRADVSLALHPNGSPPRKVVELEGDQDITETVVWKDGHYKIHGELNLKEGGRLKVFNSTVELMCSYSREFNVNWAGGTLETADAVVGGTNKDGSIYHCNFEIRDGDWFSTDTVVRYTYGQIFGDEGTGRIRGLRHNAGPNSDSVIMCGRGDVILKDSTFAIALNFYAGETGVQGDFDMPQGVPLTRVYDKSNVPGVDYRLELINHKVPFWFLFAREVSNGGPPTEVILRDCPYVIGGIMGHNLVGEVNLPGQEHGKRSIPPHSTLTVGNVTFRTLDKPAGFSGWGLYLSGTETNFTMLGPTRNAEFMLWDGNAALIGEEGTYNARSMATTIEVGRWWGGPARPRLHICNAELGHFNNGIKGQITAHNQGHVLIEHCRFGDMILMTEGQGAITLCDVEQAGELIIKENGGPITILDKCPEGGLKAGEGEAIVWKGTETLDFHHLDETPVLDGKGDEEVWGAVPWVNVCDIMTPRDGTPPADTEAGRADFAARFKAGWRGGKLYLLVDVQDDVDDHEPDGGTWMQDSCEVFLDLACTGRGDFAGEPGEAREAWDTLGGPVQLRFGADGQLAELTMNNETPLAIPEQARFAADNSVPGRTRYEIELSPRTKAGQASAFGDGTEDDLFGFALLVNDADGGQREFAGSWLGGPQQPLGQYNSRGEDWMRPYAMPKARRAGGPASPAE